MSKIKEKIALLQEYRRLKKIANKWADCAEWFSDKKLNEQIKMEYMRETTEPRVAPTNWGDECTPCHVVQVNTCELNPYVLDYNIMPEEQYLFNCPLFNEAKPCTNRNCQHNAGNKKYFYYDEKYNQAMKKYKSAYARADVARAKIFGRVK